VPRLDEELVEIERVRLLAGADDDDPGDAAVRCNRDPDVACRDSRGIDPKRLAREAEESSVIPPDGFRAPAQLRQRAGFLDPGGANLGRRARCVAIQCSVHGPRQWLTNIALGPWPPAIADEYRARG
jgi:hypothetical protein